MTKRTIVLRVEVYKDEPGDLAHRNIAHLADQILEEYPSVTLEAYDEPELLPVVKERPDEYYDEWTMLKVYNAIRACSLEEDSVLLIVETLKAAGILFRERP